MAIFCCRGTPFTEVEWFVWRQGWCPHPAKDAVSQVDECSSASSLSFSSLELSDTQVYEP